MNLTLTMNRMVSFLAITVLPMTNVLAGHDHGRSSRPDQEVRALTRQVDVLAGELRRTAERSSVYLGFREDAVIDALFALQSEARRFHKRVERRHKPWQLHKEFDRLLRAFECAEIRLHAMPRSRSLRRDWYRLHAAMRRLALRLGYGSILEDDRRHGPGYEVYGSVDVHSGPSQPRWGVSIRYGQAR